MADKARLVEILGQLKARKEDLEFVERRLNKLRSEYKYLTFETYASGRRKESEPVTIAREHWSIAELYVLQYELRKLLG